MLDWGPGRQNGAGNRRALPNNDLDYVQAMIGIGADRSGVGVRCRQNHDFAVNPGVDGHMTYGVEDGEVGEI
jgi:hypothetical protein